MDNPFDFTREKSPEEERAFRQYKVDKALKTDPMVADDTGLALAADTLADNAGLSGYKKQLWEKYPEPKARLSAMREVFEKQSLESLHPQEWKDFFAIPENDDNALYDFARKNTPPSFWNGVERAMFAVDKAARENGLLPQEELALVETALTDEDRAMFAEHERLLARRDLIEGLPDAEADEIAAAASASADFAKGMAGRVNELRDLAAKRRFVGEYKMRLARENRWAVLAAVESALTMQEQRYLDHAKENKGRLSPEMAEMFLGIGIESQRKLTPLFSLLKDPSGRNIAEDSAVAAWETIRGLASGSFNWFVDGAVQAMVDSDDYQAYAESKAQLALANQDMMGEHGVLGDAVVGFASTIPYMAVAGAGGLTRAAGGVVARAGAAATGARIAAWSGAMSAAGATMIITDSAHRIQTRIAEEGGDVSSPEVWAASVATGIAYAMVERAQVSGAFKPLSSLAKRDAFLKTYKILNKSLRVGAHWLGNTAGETLEEGLQAFIEEAAVAGGLGKDMMAEGAKAFAEEIKNSVGTMALVSAVGAGGQGMRYKHGVMDAEEMAVAVMRQQDLLKKSAEGNFDKIDREQFATESGIFARTWLSAGGGAGGEKALERAYQMHPGTARDMGEVFSALHKSARADLDAGMDGGWFVGGGGRRLKSDVEMIGEALPFVDVAREQDGSLRLTRKADAPADVPNVDLRVEWRSAEKMTPSDDALETDAGIAASVVNAGHGMTMARWSSMPLDEKRKHWREHKMAADGFYMRAPSGAEISESDLQTLGGTIVLSRDALPQVAFHEIFHAVARFMRDSGMMDEDTTADFVKVFGAPVHRGEVFNEEKAANAYQRHLSGEIDVATKTLFERFAASIKRLAEMMNVFRRNRDESEQAWEQFVGNLRQGNFRGVKTAASALARQGGNNDTKTISQMGADGGGAGAAATAGGAGESAAQSVAGAGDAGAGGGDAQVENRQGAGIVGVGGGDSAENRGGEIVAAAAGAPAAAGGGDLRGGRADSAAGSASGEAGGGGSMPQGEDTGASGATGGASGATRANAAAVGGAVPGGGGAPAGQGGAGGGDAQALGAGAWTASTPDGSMRVSGDWVVMELGEILASSDPGYPPELQPRDRNTRSSREQVERMSAAIDPSRLLDAATTDQGAPIVTASGEVVSGNGRVLALRRALANRRPGLQGYEETARARAAELGIDAAGFKHPVLLRRLDAASAESLTAVAELSNRPSILQRTEVETAEADGAMLSGNPTLMDMLAPGENGELDGRANVPFMLAFIEKTGDQSLRLTDGFPAPAAYARARRALLAALTRTAPNARALLQRMIERGGSDEGIGVKREIDGLTRAASKLLSLERRAPDYTLSDEIAVAFNRYMDYRAEGGRPEAVEAHIVQGDMFGARDELNDAIMRELGIRHASAASIGDLFASYASKAVAAPAGGVDMFGEATTKGEIFASAKADTDTAALAAAREAEYNRLMALQNLPRYSISEAGGAEDSGQEIVEKRKLMGRVMRRLAGDVSAATAREVSSALEEHGTVSAILPELFSGVKTAWPIAGMKIESAADFAKLATVLRSPYQETSKVVYLDKDNIVLDARIIAFGTLDMSMMPPRLLFGAIPDGAAGMIVSHNHPSGDPSPSHEDEQATNAMRKRAEMAGLRLIDHVITNGRKYYSFEQGGVRNYAPPEALADWEAAAPETMAIASQPDYFAGIIRDNLWGSRDSALVFSLNTKMRLVAVSRVQEVPDAADMRRRIADAALSARESASVAVWLPGRNDAEQESAVAFLRQRLQAADVKLVDAFVGRADGVLSMRQASPHLWADDFVRYSISAEDSRFMKAPNGEPSKLTEKQWLQVRTPEFKAWFGDWEHDPKNASKVVDENGEPLVVYHGTLNGEFFKFDKERIGERWSADEKGFFFTSNISLAKDYASNDFSGSTKTGKVMAVFVSSKKPLLVNEKWCLRQGLGKVFDREDHVSFWDNYQAYLLDKVEKHKSDVVVVDDGANKLAVAFSPNQIKSATDNTGAFDAGNPDIRYSIRGREDLDLIRDLPESMDEAHTVTTVSALRKADGYDDAKRGGDLNAADDIASKFIGKFDLERIRATRPDALIVADTYDSESKNLLPYALAKQLSDELGGIPVLAAAASEKGFSNTGVSVEQREENYHEFTVDESTRGKRVVIVDDVYTSGDTALGLAAAVKRMGGEPVMVATLAAGQAGRGIRPKADFRKELLDILKQTEDDFTHEYGFATSQLTQSHLFRLLRLGRRPQKVEVLHEHLGRFRAGNRGGARPSGVEEGRQADDQQRIGGESLADSPRASIRWDYPKTPTSLESYLAAVIATDRIKGRRRSRKDYEQIAKNMRSSFSVDDAMARAETYLDKAGASARSANQNEILDGVSDAGFSTVVERALLATGADAGVRAQKGMQITLRHALEDAPSLTLQFLQADSGLSLEDIFEVLPQLFSGANTASKADSKKEAGAGTEPTPAWAYEDLPAEKKAEVDARNAALEASARKLLAMMEARKKQMELEAEKRAAKAAAKAAKNKAADGADGGAAEPENEADEEAEEFALPAFDGVASGIQTAEDFALLLRVWVEETIKKQEGLDSVDKIFTDPVHLETYRKSMRAVLEALAKGWIDPNAAKTYNMIMRAVREIPSNAQANTVMRRTAHVIGLIQANAVRLSQKELIKKLRDDIKTLALKGEEVDAMEVADSRKIKAEHQRAANYIRKILQWGPARINDEKKKVMDELEARAKAYESAEKDEGAPELTEARRNDDAVFFWCADRLRILDEFGGLRSKMPAEIIKKGDEIKKWLTEERTKQNTLRNQQANRREALANEVQLTVIGDDMEKFAPEPWTLKNKVSDELTATVQQRLERMLGMSAKARAVTGKILRMLDEGTEKYRVITQEYARQIEKAMQDACGDEMSVRDLLRLLDEKIPEELNHAVTNHIEQGKRMTWDQALQLYAALCQTATYERNIGRNHRQGQRKRLQKEMPPVLLRFLQNMRAVYEARRPELSEVNERVIGLPIRNPDPLYCPVRMFVPRKDLKNTVRIWQAIHDIFKPRIQNLRDFDESRGFFEVAAESARESARTIAFAEVGMDLRSALARSETQHAFVRFQGRERADRLIEQVTDTLNGGYKLDSAAGGWENLMSKASALHTYAALSWNFVSAAKQVASIPAWANVLDGGYGELRRHLFNFDPNAAKELMESKGFRARYGAGSMKELWHRAWTNPEHNFVRRFYDAGMTLLQIGDFIASRRIATGVYKAQREHLKKSGMTDAQAQCYAAIDAWSMVEKSQQSDRPENMPRFLRRNNVIAKQIYKFQSSPLLQLSHEWHAYRMWREAAPKDKEEARKRFATAFITNHLVLPLMMTVAQEAASAILGGWSDDDDDKWKEAVGTMIANMMLGSWGGVLFVGAMLTKSAEWTVKNATSLKPKLYSNSGSFAVLSSLERLMNDGLLLPSDIANMEWALMRDDILRAAGQVNAPVRYIRTAGNNYSGFDARAERARAARR